MECNKCRAEEGTLLKEFDNNKSYSWLELSKMTEICASCGEEGFYKCENCEDGKNLIRGLTCWDCGNTKVKYSKSKDERGFKE